MYFDRKGLPGINAHPTARLSFFGNTVPRFKDRSRGLLRRMIVLPFDLCLAEDQQDRMLTEKIAHELPGILNWAIAGLRRLRQQGGFTDARVCRAVLEEHRLDTNPARAFLLDHLRRAPGGSVVISDVYGQYKDWCEDRGHTRLDDRQFGKEMQRAFPGVERVRKPGGRRQKRPWFYRGVQLVDDSPDRQPTSAPMARRRR